MFLDAPSAVLVLLFRVGSRPRNFVPKFWVFCPPDSDNQPQIQQAASISRQPWLARQLPPGRSIDIFENKPEGAVRESRPNVISRPRTRSTHIPVRGKSTSEALAQGLIGSHFYLTVPQVTMAQTSVPPPPPSTVARPVSEALLNEKVSPYNERQPVDTRCHFPGDPRKGRTEKRDSVN